MKVALTALFLIIGFNIQAVHAFVIFPDRVSFDTAFPGSGFENWDSYSSGTVITNGSTLNTITYGTNSAANALVTSTYLTSSGSNGLGADAWGFFTSTDTVTFLFSQPLTAFGIDINTFASGSGAYTATLSNGDIIGSSFDPFPGYSTGAFLGFSDSPFDSVKITAITTDAYTLDSLRLVNATTSAVVPEPSTWALLGVGLVGMAFFASRRQLAI